VKIKKFEVFGFKSENRKANIKFCPEQSSVVFGPNGSGKTTLLQIMSAFFSKSEATLMANKVKNIKCELFDEKSGKSYIVLASRIEGGGYEWSPGDFSDFDTFRSLSIGVERGIAQQNVAVSPEVIFDFLYRYSDSFRKVLSSSYVSRPKYQHRDSTLRGEIRDLSLELASFLRTRSRRSASSPAIAFDESHLNINSIRMDNIENILSEQYREASYKTSKNIQSALFDTIAELVKSQNFEKNMSELGGDFITDLQKYRDRIKNALSYTDGNSFIRVVLSVIDQYCDGGTGAKAELNPVFITLFQNIIRELKLEDENLDGINIIVTEFNKQLEFGKKLVVDKSRTAYIEVDGERHGVAELSSGERHILTFLTLMATAGKGRDFIFIDEPEISLNLKWQREILGLLEDILPSSQIIAASHSPAIRQDPSSLCGLTVERI
jgi:ABC-type lipoprotein export system ATPase subunit